MVLLQWLSPQVLMLAYRFCIAAMLQHHCCFGQLNVAFLFRKIAVAFSFTGCCTTAPVAKVAAPACNASYCHHHCIARAVGSCGLLFHFCRWLIVALRKKILLLLVCCCGCHYLLHEANCCQDIMTLMWSNLHRFAAWCCCCRCCCNSDAAAWYCHAIT